MRKLNLNHPVIDGDFPFHELMSQRIREVLIVCSDYDHFMLEEDGRIEEQLFQEYVSLSLRYPPQFTQVSTADEALKQLAEKKYDLIIVMLSVGNSTVAHLANQIKLQYPGKPVILLTPVSTKETMRILRLNELQAVDYFFSWQGDSSIMLAMVKLLEDSMNAEHDVNELGVQCIIMVEDSVRYYSSYLPVMYETLIRQARNAMTEGLNEWQQTIRMRSRPKILLARNFDEAIKLYEKYKNNLLGVISDVAYMKDGRTDPEAGFALCRHIRAENRNIPILLQSSESSKKDEAAIYGADFLYKQTKTLLKELEAYIKTNYGFGDFTFIEPSTGQPLGSVSNLRGLQYELAGLNDESFAYHTNRYDFSRWLMARSLFNLALKIRGVTLDDTGDIQGMREFIINSIKVYRTNQGKGVIAEFDRRRFDELSFFSRIGNGSLGGKGRGLAFINQQLQKHEEALIFEGVSISIPRTIVLTTRVFDDFMRLNDLFTVALNETDDSKILQAFLQAEIPERYHSDLATIVESLTVPIAVRSSSLLEDSHNQPFAGIYKTYMLSNRNKSLSVRQNELCNAVKAVYASTYYQHSKAYMKSTNNIVEDEKMAVVIQEVAGKAYDDRFYPNISGVARSLNYYPIPPEKTEEGVVDVAFGLGKTVVDGGVALRFSPVYPKKIMQLTDPVTALKSTQHTFYSLNLNDIPFSPERPDKSHLSLKDISEAEGDGSLKHLVSTYDFENNRMRDGAGRSGRKVLTFSGVLKHKSFPLADVIKSLLHVGSDAMNVPIEIEFAVNLDTPPGKPSIFSLLQIRPIVENFESSDTEIKFPLPENTIIYSEKALGNGLYKDITDIVYIKPGCFDRSRTKEISNALSEINRKYSAEKKPYILAVYGRLGSTDPWLGIPLAWPSISQARIIIESGTSDFRVEPSQGTHFFQNITSLGCGYLTINPDLGDGIFNIEILESYSAESETEFFRIVRFSEPLSIRINGKTGQALIYQG